MPLNPETRRLLPEVFRRVAVPYAGAFSTNSRATLADVVAVALGPRQVAPKHTVRHRLSVREGSPASDSHLHEFATAFGFLEESGSNYIPGKYALVTHYIRHGGQTHPYYERDRAESAVWLYALLERHGDCLIPFMHLMRQNLSHASGEFVDLVRKSLTLKLVRLRDSSLPRNASFHEAVSALVRYSTAWGVPTKRPSSVRPAERLDEKTLQGYFGRTATYASDNGLVIRSRETRVSDKGERLMVAWDAFTTAGSTTFEIPPSVEAVHDAFSIEWSKYRETFFPAISAGAMEHLVSEVVLPDALPVPWSTQDLEEEYARVVAAIGDSISGAARVDALRLAIWAHGIALGRRYVLDSEQPDDEFDPNANAAVQIGLANPRRYHLGHARSGRRFWSVTLLRNRS